jgi:hypothetical protein
MHVEYTVTDVNIFYMILPTRENIFIQLYFSYIYQQH